ncbi:MAG: EamA family transporter [candidate division Zixibacteria bacterium]|nr:EamA family transporter [candidate division Zixibacteria bacterium]
MLNKNSVFLLISILFWGFSFVAIKVALREVSPLEMISVRFLLASLTLLMIIKIKGLSLKTRVMRFKLVLAAFIVFLHFWIMATGMKETTASNAAWILAAAPVFVAILANLYLKESLHLSQWGGLGLAFVGVFLLTDNGDMANLGWLDSRADLLLLSSCVTWALYTVSTREITARVHPLVATFWMVTIAGLFFVPCTLATSGYHKFIELNNDTYLSLVFLGVFCLAIAFWLWSEGLKRGKAAEVSVYLYVEPLVAMLAGWWLLDENITVWLISGAVFISAGVYLSERISKIRTAVQKA